MRDRTLPLFGKIPRLVSAVVVLSLGAAALTTLLLKPAAGEQTPPAAAVVDTAQATVELTPQQLQAIKIAPAATYRFIVDREAVGSIWFEEDPTVIQAESTLVAAAATYKLTDKELARAKELYGANGGLAQRELEQATSDAETAAAALKAAREAVRALGESDTEIDEMIATGKIRSETAVHGPSRWLLANVSESDSPLIKPGQPVEVRAVAYPDRVFHGTVSKVYSTVDPNTHRVGVRCEIQDPVSGLRPGMLASFIIQVQPAVESTAVPVNGVVREGDGSMTVWVTADRRHFTQRTVETGLRQDGQVQILKGLGPGELVVTDGAIFLDNMLLAPPGD